LHGWSEGVDAMLGGVSDISWVPADKRLPCYRVTSLYPIAIDMTKQIPLDAAYAKLMTGEANKVGLMPLINSNYSYDQEWWFKGANTDLEKLDGKLVRSIGPLVSMMIETWGGKPVFIAPKEVFQSAERGVVDGINMGVATYSAWKLWGVMPHMVKSNLFYGNIQYMINMKKFESLSSADQKSLQAAAAESEVWLKPQYERWVDESMAEAVKQGGTVTPISAEKRNALITSVAGKWTSEVNASCGPELAGKVRTLFNQNAL
jgi:TRAP-type C4-dicarboxylate transport system substrate-binding protein